jgi:hypothetical protein
MFAMTDSKRRLIGMGIPFGLAFVTDTALTTALTVRGLRPWEVEDRLFFHTLYLIHPLAPIAGYLMWACVIIGLLLLLPDVLAVIVTIVVVFGHVGGAYSQIYPFLGSWYYQPANGLFLLTAATLGTGLWWSARASRAVHRSGHANGLPALLRWGLIALLTGVAGFMVLIPWRA